MSGSARILRKNCTKAERTRWLESRGYRMVRFWDHDVLRDTDSVAEAIRQVLTPHLNPPSTSRVVDPQGGRKPK